MLVFPPLVDNLLDNEDSADVEMGKKVMKAEGGPEHVGDVVDWQASGAANLKCIGGHASTINGGSYAGAWANPGRE